jgi:hypothetical protein
MIKSVFLTLLVLCFVQFVMAEEVAKTTTTKVPEGFGTLDMQEYNAATKKLQTGSGAKVAVTTSCTDTVGKEHKAGDPGYDACLINSSNKANQNGSSNQMNLKFGE